MTAWLEQDEGKWDEAIEVLKREIERTDGSNKIGDGRWEMLSIANVVIATK